MHNKCNALGLTQKPSSHLPHPLIQGKIVSMKLHPGAKRSGITDVKGIPNLFKGANITDELS